MKQNVDVTDTVKKVLSDISKLKELGLTDDVRQEFVNEISIVGVWLINVLNIK